MRSQKIAAAAAAVMVFAFSAAAEASIFPGGSAQQLEYEQNNIEAEQQQLQGEINTTTAEIESLDKAVSKAPAPAMPNVYGVSLALIADQAQRAAAQAQAQEYYNAGRADKAASVIGSALGAANGYSLFFLGNFCLTALPTAGNARAQADFLTGLMRGYNKCGVLMFTTAAVKRFTAFPLTMGQPWKTVPAGAQKAVDGERVYAGNGAVFIPFKYGEKFKLDIVSKAGADVRMWKILPDGANTKSWPGGTWEKEITVRGDVKFQ